MAGDSAGRRVLLLPLQRTPASSLSRWFWWQILIGKWDQGSKFYRDKVISNKYQHGRLFDARDCNNLILSILELDRPSRFLVRLPWPHQRSPNGSMKTFQNPV
jgi:hypothetical protein